MTKQTKYFSLTNASEVARLHRKEIGAPGLLRAKNFYVSASDGALTLRGDINRFRDDIPTFSDHWQVSTSGDNYDFLNTLITTGDSGSDIYLDRMFPVRPDVTTPLCDVYDTGTVTTDGTTAIVLGTDTKFVQNVHPHAFIQFSTDPELYRIASAESDIVLSLDEIPPDYTGAAYTIFLTHDSERARWPIHFEMYGSNYLYNATQPKDPEAAEIRNISGPFKLIKQDDTVPTVATAYVDLSTILKVRYLNSKFWACSVLGKIFESPDGLAWTERTVTAEENIYVFDIAWSGAEYLSVGLHGTESRVYRSTDGISWVESSAPASMGRASGVAYGAGTFVIVCSSSADSNSHVFWYTTDGVTFAEATNPNSVYGYFSVDFANTLFIATTNTVAATSADGITWASATIGSGAYPGRTIWDGTQYVTCGSYNGKAIIATSADAATWAVTLPASLPFNSCYDIDFIAGPLYIVSGYNSGISYVYSSADLLTWTLEITESLGAPKLASDGVDNFVALFNHTSASPSKWYQSVDGTTWTQIDPIGTATKITSLVYVDPYYLVTTDGGGIFKSPGGTAYSACASSTTDDLNAIVYGSIYYVAVGAGGIIVSATDPLFWTSQTSGVATALNAIAYSPSLDLFVAVGEAGTIVTSQDTITWTDETLAGPIADDFLGITWDGTDFIAVGTTGIVYTSTDGAAWTSRASGVTDDLNGVASTANLAVAVSDGGGIITSDDNGATWTEETSGTAVDLWAVARCNTRWVACGDEGKILRSSDGVTWAAITSGTSSALYAVVFDDLYTWLAGDGLVIVKLPQTGADTEFSPISDSYRANDFVVCDGYTVLVATSELEGGGWNYHPRRIRWTSPGTVDDFSGEGSGLADLNGTGHLLAARTLGHNIVIFESYAIGVLSQTGDLYAPWSYRKISEGVQLASNPVVIDDKVYFIDQNGLLEYTNGVEVAQANSPFDLSQYVDLGDEFPVWLVYRKSINCLLIYKVDSAAEEARIFVVHVDSGTTTSLDAPIFPASSDSSGNYPHSVVQIVAAYPTFPQAPVTDLNKEAMVIVTGIGIAGNGTTAGSMMVTCGQNYTRWTSNGVNWHTVYQTEELVAVAYSSGLCQWCTVGHYGAILTSTNGKVWTDRSLVASDVLFMAVTWGEDEWVAVGRTGESTYEPVVYRSADGVTWTDKSPAGISDTSFDSVAWTADLGATGRYVFGTESFSGSGVLTMYHSDDLTTYTDHVTSAEYFMTANAITWNGTDRFLSACDFAIMDSTDGENWTVLPYSDGDIPDPPNLIYQQLSGVVWNGSTFIVVGGEAHVFDTIDATAANLHEIYQENDVYGATWIEDVWWYDSKIYCATDADIGIYTPHVAFQSRATDEDAWADAGDSVGVISVSTSACTGTGTAWSNTISRGNGSTAVFSLPCLATQARIYIGDTAQILDTDYTITDTKEITFAGAPDGDSFVIAYWENEPHVRMRAGDYIETSEGLHRVIAIEDATHLKLAWYPSETLVGTHRPTKQIPEGEGETAIGLAHQLDTLQSKILVIPYPHPISGWGLTTAELGVGANADLCVLGYGASPTANLLLTARVGLEHAATGVDSFANLSTYRERWWGEIQTGEVIVLPEGQKTSVKEVWIRTYCGEAAEPPIELVGFSVVHVPSGPRVLKATR